MRRLKKRMKSLLRNILLFSIVLTSVTVGAKPLNDHVMNRPYADSRAWHLGFSVGMQFQDLHFAHTGIVDYDGTQWFLDQPSTSPGFCVNGLVDLRLSKFFNVRFNPGLYFGSKAIEMREVNGEQKARQSLKSTYLVFPVDLKFSSVRFRNSRPYISAGLMPSFDLTAGKGEYIRLKATDLYLTFGLGCDFYLPFFKFIPEIKFCFGLLDVMQHKRPDLVDDPQTMRFTNAVKKATSSMFVLTFYFE